MLSSRISQLRQCVRKTLLCLSTPCLDNRGHAAYFATNPSVDQEICLDQDGLEFRLFGSWLKRGEGIDFSLYYYHKTHLARSTITHNHQLQLPIRRFLFGVRHVFGLAWAEAIRRAKVSGPELVTSFHWHIFSKTYSDLWRHTTKIFLPRLPRDSNKFNCRTKQTELSQRRPDYNSILNQSAF